MKNSYRTIREDGQSEQEIKKSRFICSLNVSLPKRKPKHSSSLSKEHWKANHNCSAFVIGENNEINEAATMGNQAVPLVSPC